MAGGSDDEIRSIGVGNGHTLGGARSPDIVLDDVAPSITGWISYWSQISAAIPGGIASRDEIIIANAERRQRCFIIFPPMACFNWLLLFRPGNSGIPQRFACIFQQLQLSPPINNLPVRGDAGNLER